MKNKREIILDFTSLLDVIMLILFFFVMFSQIGVNDALKDAETKQTEAEQQIAEAAAEWEAANKALKQAEEQLKEQQQATALAESIILNGSADFDKALSIKLVLDGEKDDWSISVKPADDKDKVIGTISDVRNRNADEIASEFERIILKYGYSKENAFLCDLMYNSDDTGSRMAKNNTDDMLKSFRNDLGYKFLFVSTTDLSGIEEKRK